MSDYIVSVATVQLPTGKKFVRLEAHIPEGDLTTAMLFEPAVALAVAAELTKAAKAAERMIELPSETFTGLRIGDLKKGDS